MDLDTPNARPSASTGHITFQDLKDKHTAEVQEWEDKWEAERVAAREQYVIQAEPFCKAHRIKQDALRAKRRRFFEKHRLAYKAFMDKRRAEEQALSEKQAIEREAFNRNNTAAGSAIGGSHNPDRVEKAILGPTV